MGLTEFPDLNRLQASLGWYGKGKTFNESEMARSSECTEQYAQKVIDSAGIVRDACLFHENMSGAVHVLDLSQPLPHDQAFYDNQANADRIAMLTDMHDDLHQVPVSTGNKVSAGLGEVIATGGGTRTLSIMRFMQHKVTIRTGDTVEWTIGDAI